VVNSSAEFGKPDLSLLNLMFNTGASGLVKW
jgi:hypothetical protein